MNSSDFTIDDQKSRHFDGLISFLRIRAIWPVTSYNIIRHFVEVKSISRIGPPTKRRIPTASVWATVTTAFVMPYECALPCRRIFSASWCVLHEF